MFSKHFMSTQYVNVKLALYKDDVELVKDIGGGACVYKYIGEKPVGFGALFSGKKAAYIKSGDHVVTCINQYTDSPICDEKVRCHARFIATLPEHEESCTCGVCGTKFEVTEPTQCECDVVRITDEKAEGCMIM